MSNVSPIRPPMSPIERVKAQPTTTGRLMAADLEIRHLTTIVEVLAGALQDASLLARDETLRANIMDVVAKARAALT